MMCNILKKILLIFIIAFVIIAIPVFLLGCDHRIQTVCLNYRHENNVEIIDHELSYQSCGNQTCYNSYAVGLLQSDGNRTCLITVDKYESNRTKALNDAKNKYKLGQDYSFYVDKSSHECLDNSDKNYIETLANIGFIFFIIAVVLIIVLVAYILWPIICCASCIFCCVK